MSRLWGIWESQFYGSGTTIVKLKDIPGKPHLYVYADIAETEEQTQKARHIMCAELASFLNGGPGPKWLADFYFESLTSMKSLPGASISVVGPMIPVSGKDAQWREDKSKAAKMARKDLIAVLKPYVLEE